MSQELLALMQQAEQSEPSVRTAALLRIARVLSKADQAEAERLLDRGLALLAELPDDERAAMAPQARCLAAAVSPERAFALRTTGDTFGSEKFLFDMVRHGYGAAAAAYLTQWPEQGEFPHSAALETMGAIKDDDARRDILRSALRAWHRRAGSGWHSLYGLLPLLRFHWRLLPDAEARDAARSIVRIIRTWPDEPLNGSFGGQRGTVMFSSQRGDRPGAAEARRTRTLVAREPASRPGALRDGRGRRQAVPLEHAASAPRAALGECGVTLRTSCSRGQRPTATDRSGGVDSQRHRRYSAPRGRFSMAAPVFISYSRADQAPNDWRARLELYLAQARRAGGMDPWDDRRIEAGGDWRAAIGQALTDAQAAILLVGPGFLTSAFIRDHELPPLLTGARTRGIRIFPLVVGWCDYEHSDLASFQAFNDIKRPLESLSVSDQNQVLNRLSVEVSQAVEGRTGPAHPAAAATPDLRATMKRLLEQMDFADVAFRSQNARCRTLVDAVTTRLGITEHLQYELFLFRFHPQMNPYELFEFAQIRAVTDGPLAESNRQMLDLLMDHPALLDELPALTALRQHLVFWLNKYERVFRTTPAMAVCYVGVEDGVPWPIHAEEAVRQWVQAHGV